MTDQPGKDVTQLLSALGAGDPAAAAELLPLVYDELRKLARSRMAVEPEQTLQPTALVHEAYLRLVGDADRARWNGRGHFFGAAARAMRRIMVERARAGARLKRGGDRRRVSLEDNAVATQCGDDDLVALDGALERLEARDARKAQIVMLRYFAGLTVEETAAAMDLSPAMIKKEWTVARAWLYRDMGAADGES